MQDQMMKLDSGNIAIMTSQVWSNYQLFYLGKRFGNYSTPATNHRVILRIIAIVQNICGMTGQVKYNIGCILPSVLIFVL